MVGMSWSQRRTLHSSHLSLSTNAIPTYLPCAKNGNLFLLNMATPGECTFLEKILN